MVADSKGNVEMISIRSIKPENPNTMAQTNRSPVGSGARQRSSSSVQRSSAITPNPGTTQLRRPTWSDVQNFDGQHYCETFEDGLTAAINALIVDASTCSDRDDAILIRPTETISALVNVLAGFVTMDPSASPAQIRKGVDRITAHLRALALDMARRNSRSRKLMLPAVQGEGWAS
jgi:hypothetical protein